MSIKKKILLKNRNRSVFPPGLHKFIGHMRVIWKLRDVKIVGPFIFGKYGKQFLNRH